MIKADFNGDSISMEKCWIWWNLLVVLFGCECIAQVNRIGGLSWRKMIIPSLNLFWFRKVNIFIEDFTLFIVSIGLPPSYSIYTLNLSLSLPFSRISHISSLRSTITAQFPRLWCAVYALSQFIRKPNGAYKAYIIFWNICHTTNWIHTVYLFILLFCGNEKVNEKHQDVGLCNYRSSFISFLSPYSFHFMLLFSLWIPFPSLSAAVIILWSTDLIQIMKIGKCV